MAKILMEFDSPEELLAFTQGQQQGPGVATPIAVRNDQRQSITLIGKLEKVDGREVLVISVGGRPDPHIEPGGNETHLQPGALSVVATP